MERKDIISHIIHKGNKKEKTEKQAAKKRKKYEKLGIETYKAGMEIIL